MQPPLTLLTIAAALHWARTSLVDVSDSAPLDAEVLLAYCLGVSRSHLMAWPEYVLTPGQQNQFLAFIARRQQGEPLAYLTGSREFWSLDITVTPDTLIPRPDSELLVELLLQLLPAAPRQKIADLGTGSGALALAVASARPHWQIYATDRVAATLAVALTNAQRLQIHNVSFHLGFWYAALPEDRFAAIISNPPYVATHDANLADAVAQYEPAAALFAGVDGLNDLRELIEQAPLHLQTNGLLLVEHGAQQGAAVANLFAAAGFLKVITYKDLAGLDRVTGGWLS